LLTTEACLTEVMHMLKSRGTWEGFERLLSLVKRLRVELRCVGNRMDELGPLIRKYSDLPMDFADATLVDLGSTTGIRRVITNDLRDFGVYRLPDGRAFEIVGLS
jgi:uncharacterized protein